MKLFLLTFTALVATTLALATPTETEEYKTRGACVKPTGKPESALTSIEKILSSCRHRARSVSSELLQQEVCCEEPDLRLDGASLNRY